MAPPARRSLLFWLPYLWSKVLFPGEIPRLGAGDGKRLHLALVILLPAVLLYPQLGFPLLEPDESRYAQIPYEMLQRGDLLVPVLQGEPYLDKPPLLYWLIAGSYRLFGVSDGSARLVPAVSLHLTVLLVYLLGRRSLGESAAFRGSVLLALAPGFISMGRLLLLDGLLTLWIALSLFAAFEAVRGPQFRRGWWLLAALACALGILTKGPIALVLLSPPVWLHRRLTRSACPLRWGDLFLFAGVVALLTLPWYMALACQIPDFVRYFFWEHHVLRYLTSFAHERGFWFYLPVLLVGLLPGTLLSVPFVRFLLSAQKQDANQRPAELGFFLLSAGWCLVFFSLSSCKLPTYILPAFPPLALALGWFLAFQAPNSGRATFLVATSTFVLLLVFHLLVLPWYAGYRSPMAHEAVRRLCSDPGVTVVCYPRDCNAVAFSLSRSDVRSYRSKEIEELRELVRTRPRVVVLCTHRHSFEGLQQLLPPEVKVVEHARLDLADLPGVPQRWMKPLRRWLGQTSLGLGDVAVVQPFFGTPVPVGEEFAEPGAPVKSRPEVPDRN